MIISRLSADERRLERDAESFGSRLRRRLGRFVTMASIISMFQGVVGNNVTAQVVTQQERSIIGTLKDAYTDSTFRRLKDGTLMTEAQLDELAAGVASRLAPKIVQQIEGLIGRGDLIGAKAEGDYIIKLFSATSDEKLISDLERLSADIKTLFEQIPLKPFGHNRLNSTDNAQSLQDIKGKRSLVSSGAAADAALARSIAMDALIRLQSLFPGMDWNTIREIPYDRDGGIVIVSVYVSER